MRNLIACVILVLFELYLTGNTFQWMAWVLQGIAVAIINIVAIVWINYMCEPAVMNDIIAILKRKVSSVLL